MLNNDQGLRAARGGRAIHKYIVGDTVTAAFVVQTAAGIYYDIPAGHQVIVVNMNVGLDDPNEFAAAYLVGCDAVAGGGTPTQMYIEIHDHIGDKKQGHGHIDDLINPPICFKYSEGHRSVSLAVKATDTNTVIEYGWSGWVEDEGTLS